MGDGCQKQDCWITSDMPEIDKPVWQPDQDCNESVELGSQVMKVN